MNKMTNGNLISRSHERSKKYGVKTDRIFPRYLIKGADLQHTLKINRELIEVSEPIIDQLLLSVKESGFIIVLTDAQGCILIIRGGEKTIEIAHSLNMIPGAYMSEESIGTNAMGTAISEDSAIQITAKEHFISIYHQWTCSAAPIHFEGKIIGVLNITGFADLVHPHTMGLVQAAVDAIENKIVSNKVRSELEATNSFAFAMMNNLAYGVFAIDLNDEILWVNDTACRIFNIRRKSLLHKSIKQYIPSWNGIIQTLLDGLQILDQDCKLAVKDLKERFLFTAILIKDEKNEILGYLITFRHYSNMLKLANKYTGLQANYTFDDIIAHSREMHHLVNYSKTIANSPSTILITGESGTGKEVFAQAIHNASERKDSAFVPVNCGAISPSLIESELFGYEEGAFTGARKGGRPGKFELANNGTIFLDEIGEMPVDMQVRLLRVIQEGEVTRLGGDNSTRVNVRIIAATNKNLLDEVEANRFRLDLFYRINVIPIHIPALREHREDIIPLWQHLIAVKAARLDKPVPELTREILDFIMTNPWHGNIREFENYIEKLISLGNNHELLYDHNVSDKSCDINPTIPKQLMTLDHIEREAIIEAIRKLNGNISEVSRQLGIGRNTLYAKMKRYNIS